LEKEIMTKLSKKDKQEKHKRRLKETYLNFNYEDVNCFLRNWKSKKDKIPQFMKIICHIE